MATKKKPTKKPLKAKPRTAKPRKKPTQVRTTPAGKTLIYKQQRFVEEYVIDLNGKQAAIRAGYEPANADAQASYMLTLPKVKQEVDRLTEKKALKAGIKADRVVKELALIAFANMKDYARWNNQKVRFLSSLHTPYEEGVVVSEVSSSQNKYGCAVKIKLHDKVSALEKLGKHLGLWKEKTPLEEMVASIPEPLRTHFRAALGLLTNPPVPIENGSPALTNVPEGNPQ